MNYLELVNDFLIETDYSDQVTTVVGLVSDEQRAAVWVRDAWTQIQRQERWSFMAQEGLILTNAGQSEYTLANIGYVVPLLNPPTVNRVDPTSFVNNTTEKYIRLVDRNRLRWQTDTGSVKFISINPDLSFTLGPIPDAVELIAMDTWTNPIVLVLDDDVPSMGAQYHKAIVWLAIANYAREQGGEWNGLRQAAHQEYNQMYANLSNDYLPFMEPKVGLLRS